MRAAHPGDSDSLSDLAVETYAAAFGHSFSPEDLRAHVERELSPFAFTRILSTDVVLLAEQEGERVAFVQFGLPRGDAARQADAELRRLYVLERFQNRGIGERLMKAALAHPLLAGARAISLDVWERNERAQRFYRRFGFHAVGTRPFAVASGADTTPDIIMLRDGSPAA